jgi:hypothetical protein
MPVADRGLSPLSQRVQCEHGKSAIAELHRRALRPLRIARHGVQHRGADQPVLSRLVLAAKPKRGDRKDRRPVAARLGEVWTDAVRRIEEQRRRLDLVELGVEVIEADFTEARSRAKRCSIHASYRRAARTPVSMFETPCAAPTRAPENGSPLLYSP